jgi:hypothetical protein
MINPQDHKQTHDMLGRQFTTPQDGGPVPGMVHLTIGEPKAIGGFCISVQKDDQDLNLTATSDPRPALAEITGAMERYNASIPYMRWYETYVSDDVFDTFVDKVLSTLSAANVVHERW